MASLTAAVHDRRRGPTWQASAAWAGSRRHRASSSVPAVGRSRLPRGTTRTRSGRASRRADRCRRLSRRRPSREDRSPLHPPPAAGTAEPRSPVFARRGDRCGQAATLEGISADGTTRRGRQDQPRTWTTLDRTERQVSLPRRCRCEREGVPPRNSAPGRVKRPRPATVRPSRTRSLSGTRRPRHPTSGRSAMDLSSGSARIDPPSGAPGPSSPRRRG
jgi:hypothetical protein